MISLLMARRLDEETIGELYILVFVGASSVQDSFFIVVASGFLSALFSWFLIFDSLFGEGVWRGRMYCFGP